MYFLILTLSIYNAGLSIQQVGPFATIAACNSAGSVWKADLAPALVDYRAHVQSAVCVVTGASK